MSSMSSHISLEKEVLKLAFDTFEELDGKVTVIRCPGRVDASVADKFKDMMKTLVDKKNFLLVVDLGETEFMDSSGIGALVSRIAATRSNQGDIRLASVKESISKLLSITNLDKIFVCFDDVQSAVNSFET